MEYLHKNKIIINKQSTNMPDNGCYTKCFATFIAISKDRLCYTAQPEPTASDPKCNHILQSDIKETVVNKSTTRVFENKCPFCKESQRKVN